MTDLVVGDPRGDADLERFADVDAESFGESREHTMRWLDAARGRLLVRLAREGDEVLGGYALMPVGQWFGGRSVPAQAVTAVSVRPASRRRGVAGALMRDVLHVAREQGAALAPLHAATTRLYRRWGWEVCDRAFIHTVRSHTIARFSGSGQPVRNPDLAAVETLRRSFLHQWDGPLDRPDWWLAVEWDIEEPAQQRFKYGWMEGDALTGFARYQQVRQETPWMTVKVREFIATTSDAFFGLLGLVGGHEAQSLDVIFTNSSFAPRPELLYVIPDVDRFVQTHTFICWMQRIVDVPAAARARGWVGSVDGSVELEVTDPATDNVERMVLEVSGGNGEVSPGGAGRIQCGIGALGAWYSGTLRAVDAARIGMMCGSDDDLRVMDSLIGDRRPWMPDHF